VRKRTWDQHPLLIEQEQPGVVRSATLEDIGVARSSISRRCRKGGPWQRLLPGVILLGNAVPTDVQRLRAAVLYVGDSAVVTGIWALRLHGLRNLPDAGDIQVLAPTECRTGSGGFITVERTTRVPTPHTRLGIPLAPVHRAVLDAARRQSDFDTIIAMMAEAIQRRRCTAKALADEVRDGNQRGTAIARRALAPLLNGAHSVAEVDAWKLWQLSGLPPCQWNVKLFGADGRHVATPDAWCDDVALAWEIDSRGSHSEHSDFADTLARNARYVAAGVVVLQALPARLRTEPGKVLDEIHAAYETARSRPRPDVHLR
jgi:hypothetical protein